VNAPIDSFQVVERDESADVESVDQMIARVLGQAHQTAMALGTPAEARVILTLAQSFADELAAAITGFDRLAFLAAVIEDAS
jgi:hypothetical protein